MNKIVEDLREKKWQFWLRMSLRFLCGGLLVVYAVFAIAIPKINGEALTLDTTDGYVILGCVAIYLAVEAVRAIVLAWAKSKTGNNVS